MSLTLPYPTLGPGVVDSAQLTSNFTAISSKFGSIDNSDVKAGANIALSKLAASYEYLVIPIIITDGTATNERLVPIYNDGKGDWTYVATSWATADTGTPAGTCVLTVEWGAYNGGATPGAFTVTSTIDTVALAGTAIASQGSDASPSVTSLASGTNRSLRIYCSTTDADCGSPIYVSALLKRQIAT